MRKVSRFIEWNPAQLSVAFSEEQQNAAILVYQGGTTLAHYKRGGVSFMKRQINQARWIAILAATTIALYLCWLMLRPFIGVLEWAAVLVIVFYPIHKVLARKIKRRGFSALLSSLLVVLIVVAPVMLISIALANELAHAARELPLKVASVMETQGPLTARVSQWMDKYATFDTSSSQQFVAQQLKDAGTALLGQTLGMVGNIVSGVLKAFLVIFVMYYLFRDSDKILQALPLVLPLKRAQSEVIIARVGQVVSASVYGVVAIAMIQGLLGGLAFWALGVPSPILWAVVMTFVCMIPIAGSFMVWIPLSVYLMLENEWIKAISLMLWGGLIVSTVDNFLRPKLIKNKTKLHELFVFFSVLGGMRLFGLLGIVLGPVLLAITLGLLDTFRLTGSSETTSRNPSLSPSTPVKEQRTAAYVEAHL